MLQLTVMQSFRILHPHQILPGGANELETKREMLDHCDRLIVVLSPAFLLSRQNQYLSSMAHSTAVTNNNRKLIPVVHKPCVLPPLFKSLTRLNYNSPTPSFYDFWQRLSDSLTSKRMAANPYRLREPAATDGRPVSVVELQRESDADDGDEGDGDGDDGDAKSTVSTKIYPPSPTNVRRPQSMLDVRETATTAEGKMKRKSFLHRLKIWSKDNKRDKKPTMLES